MRLLSCIVLLAVTSGLSAAEYLAPTSAVHVGGDVRFSFGETVPGVRVHYRTLGTPRRGEDGRAINAILTLHGTTGSGANFLRPEFAGELFGKNQRLDAERYYLILPTAIGHGGSSKPSDGLRARFRRYGYRDMIEALYRLVTQGL
jgi:homoserine O-acetyltransferase